MNILEKLKRNHHPHSGALELLKYIGPGLLVTVGFIDPGNWATNLAAGSEFGYALLWVVTFSSIMLIIIQHNVAHLGIVTGLCLSEATTQYLPKKLSLPILISAMMASISTSLAEILGGAIALKMLFSIPIKAGAVIVTLACLIMLLGNTYSKIERWIIMFVSIIGLSVLYELAASDNLWEQRISIVCTWAFIRRSDFTDTLALAERLMTHKHDLMHKAVGWMLREVGKRDRDTLTDFLERYATQLPRTALRYAIEHYPEDRRQYFLKMK